MTDRRAIIGFIATGLFLFTLIVISAILDGAARKTLIDEGGLVESASAFGYLACIVMVIWKGRMGIVKSHHTLLILMAMFMLRELDYDKKFTTEGIFTSKLYKYAEVPLYEKIAGAMIIGLFVYCVVSLIYHHGRDLYQGLQRKSSVAWGAVLAVGLLLLAKTLDGISRKLETFGIEMSKSAHQLAKACEEIVELGIPIIMILSFLSYFWHRYDLQSQQAEADTSDPPFNGDQCV